MEPIIASITEALKASHVMASPAAAGQLASLLRDKFVMVADAGGPVTLKSLDGRPVAAVLAAEVQSEQYRHFLHGAPEAGHGLLQIARTQAAQGRGHGFPLASSGPSVGSDPIAGHAVGLGR